ncbi:hypothetical protein AG1IA_04869 [Rhizoctonia solani AG-1 IA]|uniref:Uncharacterized protein n=1 Tax=Thanatephorus cucumeris (strain AG1-IA) TaxID=983506 RepID=L8WSJ5_THACA|nr:hypothetical protein AG1IA_04869 [Rhizoctonia solani AG-1 IA]
MELKLLAWFTATKPLASHCETLFGYVIPVFRTSSSCIYSGVIRCRLLEHDSMNENEANKSLRLGQRFGNLLEQKSGAW